MELTVSASGDILIHSPLWERARANAGGSGFDFRPLLEPIRPRIERADLAICQLETPIGPGEPQTEPLFKAPAEVADAVAATGFDACSTASNHSLDQHLRGIRETIAALDAAGVQHTGTYGERVGSGEPLMLEAGGAKIALVAYTDYTNGIPVKPPWSVNFAESPADAGAILDDAREARKAGAEAVIVTMHWGPENATEPDADQRRMAEALTASPDVTAVVGQGPHVVQPISMVNGKFVVYSEGNLLSNQDANCCPPGSQDGLIAELDLVIDGEGDRVEAARYIPIWVDHSDYAVLAVGDALKAGRGDAAALAASYERTVSLVGSPAGVSPVPVRLPGAGA